MTFGAKFFTCQRQKRPHPDRTLLRAVVAMDAIMSNLHHLHGELTARASSPSPSPSSSPSASARRRQRRSTSPPEDAPELAPTVSFAHARAAIERECAALGEREAFEMRRARDLGALRAPGAHGAEDKGGKGGVGGVGSEASGARRLARARGASAT